MLSTKKQKIFQCILLRSLNGYKPPLVRNSAKLDVDLEKSEYTLQGLLTAPTVLCEYSQFLPRVLFFSFFPPAFFKSQFILYVTELSFHHLRFGQVDIQSHFTITKITALLTKSVLCVGQLLQRKKALLACDMLRLLTHFKAA